VSPERALRWASRPDAARSESRGSAKKQPYEVYRQMDFDIPIGRKR